MKKVCTFAGVGTYVICDTEEEAQEIEATEHAFLVVNGFIDAGPRSIALAEKFIAGTLTRSERLDYQRTGEGRPDTGGTRSERV